MKKKAMSMMLVAVLSLAAACAVQAATAPVWKEYSPGPVYSPGSKVYYPTILENAGSYTMWYTNGNDLYETTSPNGVNWVSDVAADSGLAVGHVTHPLVENIGGTYRIWYQDTAANLYSIGSIHTATSTDGVTWTNDKALTQVYTDISNPFSGTVVNGNTSGTTAWNEGTYGACDVIYNASGSATIVDPTSAASVWANKYVMYYDGTSGHTESVGLAVSNDGVNWEGYDGGTAAVFSGAGGSAWDSQYATWCSISVAGPGVYEMYYSGGSGNANAGIGYATSSDGIDWTRSTPDSPIFSVNDLVAWRAGRTYTPVVIGNQMWFTGAISADSSFGIGYATSPAPVPEPISMMFFGTGLVAVGGFFARRRMLRKP